jgi:hypothetical protein
MVVFHPILTIRTRYSDAFKTPADPAMADLTTLQNQLNTYLAMEAGVRVRLSSEFEREHN